VGGDGFSPEHAPMKSWGWNMVSTVSNAFDCMTAVRSGLLGWSPYEIYWSIWVPGHTSYLQNINYSSKSLAALTGPLRSYAPCDIKIL
jgi:hypothetical protein